MDNFFFGLQAVSSGGIDLLHRITAYKMFWGFALGFLVSTLLHGFLLTDNPKDLPDMLLKDKATSFQKIYPQDEKNVYHQSFQSYIQKVDKIKFVFATAALLFILIALLVLLTW